MGDAGIPDMAGGRRRDIVAALAFLFGGAALAGALSAAFAALSPSGPASPTNAHLALPAALHLGFMGFVLLRYARGPRTFSGERLGTRANGLTAFRLALIASFAGPLVEPAAFAGWWSTALAILALALDGLDGALARRDGDASPFGAWFDQEEDALFVVLLCALAWRLDRAGPWVLVAGLWRYLWILATTLTPRLRGELPPSRRRRVVCATLLGALIGCVSPLLPREGAVWVGAIAVALVSISFLIDGAALWTRTSPATP